MPKHRLILLAIVCAAVLVGMFSILTRSPEPSYAGRSLSEWLDGCVKPQPAGGIPHGQGDAASVAIAHIGTNAIPYLLKWLHYEEPPLRKLSPPPASPPGRYVRWTPTAEENLQSAARSGFYHLGAQAKPAIPELVRLINDPEAPETAAAAADALAYVGTQETLPPLMALLTNHQHPAHATAVAVVRRLGTNAFPAIPALIECLQDSDQQTPVLAAASLGNIHAQPTLVVPALAPHLSDPDARMRRCVAFALGRYGAAAQPTVPALLTALQDTDQAVREMATNALLKIAPEALTNAPAQ